jgi:hypothetical protein
MIALFSMSVFSQDTMLERQENLQEKREEHREVRQERRSNR